MEHPGVQLKKILLATDFRESAMAATEWAADRASDLDVPLVLAHVVEPVVVGPQWEAFFDDFENERVAAGERMLAKMSATLRNTHTDCVVSIGHPDAAIASLAVERGAGLVVMGLADPGDSGPHKPFSIAYAVVRLAHLAVVVVPAVPRPTGQPVGALANF